MAFKINISDKTGKTYKLELESEDLIGKSLHDVIKGTDILPALEGYELEITGTSDKSGFTSHKDIDSIGLKKVLLTEYGKGMKVKPRREGKKKLTTPKPKGLRLRRTMRGKIISPAISQINLKVLKTGAKTLSEAFPDQNKPKEEPKPAEETKPVEEVKPVEEAPKIEENPVEAPKEENKVEEPKVEEPVKEEEKAEDDTEKADPKEEAEFEEKLEEGEEEAEKAVVKEEPKADTSKSTSEAPKEVKE